MFSPFFLIRVNLCSFVVNILDIPKLLLYFCVQVMNGGSKKFGNRRSNLYRCVGVSVSVGKMIKSVEELDVYKKAHELTLKLYKITKIFPNDEKFGLISQIRRAASSIRSEGVV